jgi:DNA-binding NarL/FixJ family response regulator
VRVLIVDDAATFREAAREVLVARGYDVVGEAADAASALAEADRLAPEAVLLDLRLDADSGFELSARLRGRVPPPRVLMVSADDAGVPRASGSVAFAVKSSLAHIDLGVVFGPQAD